MSQDGNQIVEIDSVRSDYATVAGFLSFLFNDIARNHIENKIYENSREHARLMRDQNKLFITDESRWPYVEVVAKYPLSLTQMDGKAFCHTNFIPSEDSFKKLNVAFRFSFHTGFEGEQDLKELEDLIKKSVETGNFGFGYWVNREIELPIGGNGDKYHPCYFCAKFW